MNIGNVSFSILMTTTNMHYIHRVRPYTSNFDWEAGLKVIMSPHN